jgi:hypothetical protein
VQRNESFTTGRFPVVQFDSSQKPFVAFGNVPKAVVFVRQPLKSLGQLLPFASDSFGAANANRVLDVGAVAEVQAKDVSAGVEQGADGGKVQARGAERGDDLGVADAAHGVL